LSIIEALIKLIAGKGKQYGTPSKTKQGKTVRSHGEQQIADYLHENNIRYQHEAPAFAGLFGPKISKPDFYLPDYHVFVEYWGMVDVEDRRTRERYVKNMKWKMRQYHVHHIKFISIYPSNLDNLDWIFRAKFKKETGKDLPKPIV